MYTSNKELKTELLKLRNTGELSPRLVEILQNFAIGLQPKYARRRETDDLLSDFTILIIEKIGKIDFKRENLFAYLTTMFINSCRIDERKKNRHLAGQSLFMDSANEKIISDSAFIGGNDVKQKQKKKICKVAGCNRQDRIVRGYCGLHYQRFMTHGTVHKKVKVCSQCGKIVKTFAVKKKEVCIACYKRHKRHGSYDNLNAKTKKCTSCGDKIAERSKTGLCERCYKKKFAKSRDEG